METDSLARSGAYPARKSICKQEVTVGKLSEWVWKQRMCFTARMYEDPLLTQGQMGSYEVSIIARQHGSSVEFTVAGCMGSWNSNSRRRNDRGPGTDWKA